MTQLFSLSRLNTNQNGTWKMVNLILILGIPIVQLLDLVVGEQYLLCHVIDAG